MMTAIDHRALEAYTQLMSANGAVQVYRAAQQTGVLRALASGPASAAAVAQACGTAIRPTALLLNGLVALGLVELTGEGYGLAPAARFLAGHYQISAIPIGRICRRSSKPASRWRGWTIHARASASIRPRRWRWPG